MKIHLGTVDLPDGVLVILDPGLANFWRHAGDPASPRRGDPRCVDIQISGPDARAAGAKWDREFNPFALYDVEDPGKMIALFAEFARAQGFDAKASVLPERVTHTARLRVALEVGGGLGVVTYNGLWCVAVAGFQRAAQLAVTATPMPPGDFAKRLQSVDIVAVPDAEVARTDRVEGVMVDHGQLMFTGPDALGQFKMNESLDGLADFVFWGKDGEALAEAHQASLLEEGLWGWRDLPVDEIGRHASAVQEMIEARRLKAGVDYRPHSNLERLNSQMRVSADDTAEIAVGGSRVTACGNRWGDGIFAVTRSLDASGRLVRVRVELGTEKRQALLRRVLLRRKLAVVTKPIAKGSHVRFAERTEPNNARDSGWCFSAGGETDAQMESPSFLELTELEPLLQRQPELESILGAPVGAVYRREDGVFVIDDSPLDES